MGQLTLPPPPREGDHIPSCPSPPAPPLDRATIPPPLSPNRLTIPYPSCSPPPPQLGLVCSDQRSRTWKGAWSIYLAMLVLGLSCFKMIILWITVHLHSLQYKPKTLNPRWLEQFDLHMFDDHTSHLELSVWDHDTAGKDDIMGR